MRCRAQRWKFGSRIGVGPGTPDGIRLPGLLGRTT
jgi:hypothetical protein